MKPVDLYFLHHSGFMLELETMILVFDYYLDPLKRLEDRLEKTDKPVYFFVSHVHGDHFNRAIRKFEKRASGYFLHRDCHLALADESLLHEMDVGETVNEGPLSVHMYGSTDAGGSYMVEAEGLTIFHAGDLNWWHWAGEGDSENREARDWFFRELSCIKEKEVDIAMLPVDARQQAAREWGVKAYLSHFSAGLLIPMHAFGQRWAPSYEFRWLFPKQQMWIPKEDGDHAGREL
ncbi:MBL fold metallo-hydrolase [uncultured Dialister sp.]|jgi:L-ascorbate metabolism protein UlaG (beta-lactamase superfamily)|uniref:MBL fold metallo-hydrolase n=1 Tax=uncultured Dialister sp. TaxID=278064 RepID=UPI0025D64814|nr:MBL fold metallo-hydrolase [uncultured Dialister sp.]